LRKLKNGLASFYKELDEINNKPAQNIWDYLLEFPKNIHNVGSALICDFIKGVGYKNFVKVDHHFKKEFPQLLGFANCDKLTAKEHFILSREITELLNISPFHLDHLLYQWGRYKKYEHCA
jgi:thermostable 8-oxoguanine DNA glycosylase